MQLTQKRLVSSQQLIIKGHFLEVSAWTLLGGTKKWSIRLDEIGFRDDTSKMPIYSNGCLASVIIIMAATVVITQLSFLPSLVVVFVAITPLLLGRLFNSSGLELPTRKGPLMIGYTKKQQAEADVFIVQLKSAVKEYMIWRYGSIDEDLSLEKQIENYWWLRNNEYITDEEYREMKIKLKAAKRTNS